MCVHSDKNSRRGPSSIPRGRTSSMMSSVILGLRYETGDAERSRAGSVPIEPTGHTLEVIPPFNRLHAAKHRVQVLQWTIAVGTSQRGRGNLRVLRHRCRSHQVWSATFAGGAGVLTHVGDESNRLAASSLRNPMHLAVALSFSQASRCPSEVTPQTKVSPLANFSECG